jgi:hypothetical protein
MRKVLIVAVFAVAILGMLAPPVFAQAPTPKVTLTGLFDQVTTGSLNVQGNSFSRTSTFAHDNEWYARTRFRPDFVYEVGRTKAVLGLELDLTYGQVGACSNGPGKNVSNPAATGAPSCLQAHPGTTADAGLNTDVTGIVEIKWMYTEFDLTGKDGIMPFIPVPTVARAGLQPFSSLAQSREYALYAGGDFAGFAATTTFAPNLKTKLAFVVIEDELATFARGGPGAKLTRGHDWAIIASPEYEVFKGLNIKPMYSIFHAEGLTGGQSPTVSRRGAADPNLVGGTMAAAATFGGAAGNPNSLNGDPAYVENRHTIGGEASWRMGPWGLDPVFYYQFGNRDVMAQDTDGQVKKLKAKMNSWLFDTVGSFQTGPLLIEVRGIYSPGNKARDNLSKRIRYFEPLDEDTSYYSGWGSILALGIDYTSGCGAKSVGMCTNVGYDRYGRAQLGVRTTYALTPALSVWGVLSPTWTAEKVDVNTSAARGALTLGSGSSNSFVDGQERYLGTEMYAGMTWKFAANTALDLGGSWLSAGKALDHSELAAGVVTRRKAEDAYLGTARVRLAF